jgi:hypothetical protein
MLHRFRATVACSYGKTDGIGVLVRLRSGDARNGGEERGRAACKTACSHRLRHFPAHCRVCGKRLFRHAHRGGLILSDHGTRCWRLQAATEDAQTIRPHSTRPLLRSGARERNFTTTVSALRERFRHGAQ